MAQHFRLSIFIFTLSSLFSVVYSQGGDTYEVVSDYSLSEEKVLECSKKLSGVHHGLNSPRPYVISKFKEICTKRGEYFKELNENNLLMDNCELTKLVQDITDALVAANDFIPKVDYQVFIQRNSSINAANFGEGIIVINIGLLARINNLEELAFVIAHEMSHDVRQHVRLLSENSAIVKTDNKIKQDLKTAKKQKYGSYTAVQTVAYRTLASMNLHSRQNEIVADSLGVAICANAGIVKEHAISLLHILDNADEMLFLDTLDLISLISTKNYKLDTSDLREVDLYAHWDKAEDLFKTPDSLKTHPACDSRIFMIENVNDSKFTATIPDELKELKDKWNGIKQDYFFEYLHTLMEEGNVSKAQYYALCVKNNGLANNFIETFISSSFYQFADAIRNYKFGDITVFPGEKYSKGYNQYLEFIHHQNSKKFLSIGDSYFNQNVNSTVKNEFVTFTKEFGCFISTRHFTSAEIKEEYFKNHFYKQKIVSIKNND